MWSSMWPLQSEYEVFDSLKKFYKVLNVEQKEF